MFFELIICSHFLYLYSKRCQSTVFHLSNSHAPLHTGVHISFYCILPELMYITSRYKYISFHSHTFTKKVAKYIHYTAPCFFPILYKMLWLVPYHYTDSVPLLLQLIELPFYGDSIIYSASPYLSKFGLFWVGDCCE